MDPLLERLKNSLAITAIKTYKVHSIAQEVDSGYKVYFVRYYSAVNNHKYISSYTNGKLILPPESAQGQDLADKPMQKALYNRSIVIVPEDDPDNRHGVTTAIVPRYDELGRIIGAYVFHFEKGVDKIPEREDMATIARLFHFFMLSDYDSDLHALERHEVNDLVGLVTGHVQLVKNMAKQLQKQVGDQTQLPGKMVAMAERAQRAAEREHAFRKGIDAMHAQALLEEPIIARKWDSVFNFLNDALTSFITRAVNHPTKEMLGEDADVKVYLDPGALQQIFANIIKNSENYKREDVELEIKIQARVIRDSYGKPIELEIIYQDNGQGVDKENLPKIFFYKETGDAKGRKKGTGFGLFLVKQFVHMHGGTIIVESEKDQYFRLIMKFPTDG